MFRKAQLPHTQEPPRLSAGEAALASRNGAVPAGLSRSSAKHYVTWLEDPPKEAETPIKNPKSYHLPLLFVSYMRTPALNKLTINVMGMIIPCQRPAQKPAGSASATWYVELGPATARMLATVLSLLLVDLRLLLDENAG